MSLHVRAAGDPATALGLARAEVQAMDRPLPITGVLTFGDDLRQSLWAPRMGACAARRCSGCCRCVLAVIGIYGVMSYSVSQRTREIGLRMALGADQGDVLRLVVTAGPDARGARASRVGLALSFAATRLVGNLLFDVPARDPLIFVGIPLVLGLAALVASVQPAWRAAQRRPHAALRLE